MTQEANPLARLAELAQQRRARTKALESAVQSLLSRLDDVLGDDSARATVGGMTLARVHVRLNHGGYWATWQLSGENVDDFESGWQCDLEQACGSQGYLGGDFGAPYTGPTRYQLVAFAQRAERFVAELTRSVGDDIAHLDIALPCAQQATEQL